jgi:microcin C transport system substrate-binding protein
VRTGERAVRFNFTGGLNRELPLIVGQLPVLPKHFWEGRDFEAALLKAPLGSGPYRIADFEPNRHVVYERVPDYWGANHPTQKGFWNFERIRYDYYRDATVIIEAFKSGAFDYRSENSSKAWATAYQMPALRDGMVVKKPFEHNRPAGMQGFVMNQRRAKFSDPRVRQALSYAFDFEWSNKALFYGQYVRTRSYFDNSELASVGVPKGDVLKILEKYRGRIPDEIFTKSFEPSKTDGSGKQRRNLRTALSLLKQAGWVVDPKTKKLTNAKSGETMSFEILLISPLFERIALPYTRNLKRLGVEARVRTVESAQYKERVDRFDYDMVVANWGQSASPGNEQRNYWSLAAAERNASRNYSGLKDPVVDELIELIVGAPDRKSLVTRVRVLDAVLQWRHLVVPHWHIPYDRLVFWNRFGQPAVTPDQGAQFFAWWIDPAKDEKLARYRRSATKSN